MIKSKNMIRLTLLYAILIAGIFLCIYPFFWVIINSTYDTNAVYHYPPHVIPGSKFIQNLIHLNQTIHIGRIFFNSLFIALIQTFLATFIALMAGYAFSKFNFRGKNVIFSIFLLSMMLPYQIVIISLFLLFSKINLLNSYYALILPGLVNVFIISFMRQSLEALPDELLEAARTEGYSEFQIFFKIVVPLMRSSIAAAGIFIFMASWNNFMWPLVSTTTPEMQTLPVALSSLTGFSIVDYGQVMMGIDITVIPLMIVFFILQKQFIGGILKGGIK